MMADQPIMPAGVSKEAGLSSCSKCTNVKWMRPGGPKGRIDDLKGSYKEPAVHVRLILIRCQ